MTNVLTNSHVEYRGYHIAFHRAGKGHPIIMIHNGGSSHVIWKRQISYFSKNFQVNALDLLGFGDSDRPAIPYTLGLYVDLLNDFIEQHDFQAPILMGNCIGASIALEFALRNPQKVGPMILCNVCGGAAMMKHAQAFMFSKEGRAYSATTYKRMFVFSRLNFIKKRVLARLYGSLPIEENEIYHALFKGMDHPMQTQSRLMLLAGIDTFNKFDAFQGDSAKLPPILVCWGADNRVLPLERGKLFIQSLKPAKRIIYPQLGHLLMAENPTRFNRDVEIFLRETQINPAAFNQHLV